MKSTLAILYDIGMTWWVVFVQDSNGEIRHDNRIAMCTMSLRWSTLHHTTVKYFTEERVKGLQPTACYCQCLDQVFTLAAWYCRRLKTVCTTVMSTSDSTIHSAIDTPSLRLKAYQMRMIHQCMNSFYKLQLNSPWTVLQDRLPVSDTTASCQDIWETDLTTSSTEPSSGVSSQEGGVSILEDP